jgi:hypothetical protein
MESPVNSYLPKVMKFDRFVITNREILQLVERAEQHLETLPLQLPIWPDDKKAVPNSIARSSLFTSIPRGPRKLLKDEELASPKGTTMYFTGERLDMSECDVFLLTLDMARHLPLGQPIKIKRAEFIRALGKKERGGNGYKILADQFKRLTTAHLSIETPKYKAYLNLVSSWVYNKDTKEFEATIDPKIIALFSNSEFAHIDWHKRLQISSEKKDLAKWMQGYIASHSPGKPHKIGLLLLRGWSGYTVNIRKYKTYMLNALKELERLEIITNSKITKDGFVSYERI